MAAKMRELNMIGRKKNRSRKAAAGDENIADQTSPRGGGEKKEGRRRGGGSGGGRGESGGTKKTKLTSGKKSKSRDVARLVMSLVCHGYEEQLAWLEAYLRDEARDRTVDGVCVCVCVCV